MYMVHLSPSCAADCDCYSGSDDFRNRPGTRDHSDEVIAGAHADKETGTPKFELVACELAGVKSNVTCSSRAEGFPVKTCILDACKPKPLFASNFID